MFDKSLQGNYFASFAFSFFCLLHSPHFFFIFFILFFEVTVSAIYFSVLYLNTMHRVDGLHIEGPELNTLNLVIMIFSRTSKRVV